MASLKRAMGVASMVLALSAVAEALTIEITGGFLDLSRAGVGSFDVQGDGFRFTGQLDTSVIPFAPPQDCLVGCIPGTSIGLDLSAVGSDIRNGVAVLGGMTFNQVGGLISASSAGISFDGTALAPAVGPSPTSVTAPFTFTGFFFHTDVPVIDIDIVGAGTATLHLRLGSNLTGAPAWFYGSEAPTGPGIRYEFAAPIPEPASVLLFASGLLGVATAVRRRRHR